jgi:hypothetical protein
MPHDDGGRLEPRRVRTSVPRDNVKEPVHIRPSRGWVTVILGVGALPAAWVGARLGLDEHVVFAALWAAATLVQAPPRAHRYDWLAMTALGLYLVSFVLPAGTGAAFPAEGGVVIGQLRGYEVLLEPPVQPLPRLPPGELLALVVGITSWLANPAMIIALAFYRFREATWAMVLGGLAVMMGLMELPGVEFDLAHLAWLGAPAVLAAAGALAREDY